MRIIGGSFGGRRLAAPKGAGTRPTSDRVRESLFSQLEAMDVLRGARIADLFAGSGGLGFEAMSRGGESVVFVDAWRAATRVIRENAKALGVAAEVVEAQVRSALDALGEFDLVFLDPPYPFGEEELSETLGLLVGGGGTRLTEGAVVVVERSARSPEPTWPGGLERFRVRVYGETAVYFAEPAPTTD